MREVMSLKSTTCSDPISADRPEYSALCDEGVSSELCRFYSLSRYKVGLLLKSKSYNVLISNNELFDTDAFRRILYEHKLNQSDRRILELCLLLSTTFRQHNIYDNSLLIENKNEANDVALPIRDTIDGFFDVCQEFVNRTINDEKLLLNASEIVLKLLVNICIWLVETKMNLNLVQLSYELLINTSRILNTETLDLYIRHIINDTKINSSSINYQSYYWKLRLVQVGLSKGILIDKDISRTERWIKQLMGIKNSTIYIIDEIACVLSQIWLQTKDIIDVPYKLKLTVATKLLSIGDYTFLKDLNLDKLISSCLFSPLDVRKLALQILSLSLPNLDAFAIRKYIQRLINRKGVNKYPDLGILTIGSLLFSDTGERVEYRNKLNKLLFDIVGVSSSRKIFYNFKLFLKGEKFYEMKRLKAIIRTNCYIIRDLINAQAAINYEIANSQSRGLKNSIFILMLISALVPELNAIVLNCLKSAIFHVNFTELSDILGLINDTKIPCIFFDRFTSTTYQYISAILEHYLYKGYNVDLNQTLPRILKSITHSLEITEDKKGYSFIPYAINVVTNLLKLENEGVFRQVERYIYSIFSKILKLLFNEEGYQGIEIDRVSSNTSKFREKHSASLKNIYPDSFIKLSISKCFSEACRHVKLKRNIIENMVLLFNDVNSTHYIMVGIYHSLLYFYDIALYRILSYFFLYTQSQSWDSKTFSSVRNVLELFLFKREKKPIKIIKGLEGSFFKISKALPARVGIQHRHFYNDFIRQLLRLEFVNITSVNDVNIFNSNYTLKSNLIKLKHHDCPGE